MATVSCPNYPKLPGAQVTALPALPQEAIRFQRRESDGLLRQRGQSGYLGTKLMPHAAHVKVCDNSAEAAADGTVPDPVLVLGKWQSHLACPR